MSNFSLDSQFSFLDQICQKNSDSGLKKKKWPSSSSSSSSTYSNWSKYKIWAKTKNFYLLGYSSLKQKNWTSLKNSAYSKQFRYQISVETDNFVFLDQTFPKKCVLGLRKETLTTPSNSAYSN